MQLNNVVSYSRYLLLVMLKLFSWLCISNACALIKVMFSWLMSWIKFIMVSFVDMCGVEGKRRLPLQKRGLLFLTKRLPRKRNQNWRTFDYFQKVIVCESK